MKNEIAFWGQYRNLLAEFGRLTEEEAANIAANIERLTKEKRMEKPDSLLGWIAFGANEDWSNEFTTSLESAFNTAFSFMNEWMDMRIEMAHVATEAAKEEADAAKTALEVEQQARANGYAHNLGYARAEYEKKLQLQKQALAEEQKLAKIQQEISDAQQVASLLVATANMWAAYTAGNIAGPILAGIATAAMWGSFAMAKVKAANLVNTKQYGDGMTEYLNYGGSHASGNDIDFGVTKDGTRRRVERGEMIAVINKRNVGKYGVGKVENIISALNTGTFDDKYGLAFAGMSLASASTDLTKVEDGISTLVSQNEKRVIYSGGTRIEYCRNRKRIIRG